MSGFGAVGGADMLGAAVACQVRLGVEGERRVIVKLTPPRHARKLENGTVCRRGSG